MAAGTLLPETSPGDLLARRRDPVDPETLAQAARIIDDVRTGGFGAVRARAQRHDGLAAGEPILFERDELDAALGRLPAATRTLLERTAGRIDDFAKAQRACLDDLELRSGVLSMGHRVLPVDRAGCHAPGGDRPRPSAVLMTAVTARAAGVGEVWVATPRPGDLMLGAAAIAGADAVLGAGGAHAIGALAWGAGPVPACDAVVGPGGTWVAAAKRVVAGITRVDGSGGAAELVVLADVTADPEAIAADLLAVVEHDEAATPVLLTPDQDQVAAVRRALAARLRELAAAECASRALQNGRSVIITGIDEGVKLVEQLAPERLALRVGDAPALASRVARYGTLLVGEGACTALGEHGAGPNHALPGGGSAHRFSGLSVLTFLRLPTWIAVAGTAVPDELIDDVLALTRLERLEAHAAAARLRKRTPVATAHR